ncbi:MAG: hypothetical protein JWR82_1469 [Blastococcus sp.]|jgi:hypothetical protein|nr:hypothetical protein [Blastococcus sp.]
MAPRSAAAVVAALVLVVGVIVGLWPHSIPLDYQPADGSAAMSCGSAFAGDSSAAEEAELGRHIRQVFEGGDLTASAEQYQAQCSDAMSTARVAAWVLIGGGVLALLFLSLIGQGKADEAEPAEGAAPPAV